MDVITKNRTIISNLISVIAAVTNRVVHMMKMDHIWKIVNSQVLVDTQILEVSNHLQDKACKRVERFPNKVFEYD